jgi:hypothetical protein
VRGGELQKHLSHLENSSLWKRFGAGSALHQRHGCHDVFASVAVKPRARCAGRPEGEGLTAALARYDTSYRLECGQGPPFKPSKFSISGISMRLLVILRMLLVMMLGIILKVIWKTKIRCYLVTKKIL